MERNLYPNLKLTIYRIGVRQKSLAHAAGIQEAHMSKIINGTRRPAPELKQRIAQVLQESADWLFEISQAGWTGHRQDEKAAAETALEEVPVPA